jgi:hypothetical protein
VVGTNHAQLNPESVEKAVKAVLHVDDNDDNMTMMIMKMQAANQPKHTQSTDPCTLAAE